MTVQTNTNVASFNGNGVTQIFPIAFKFNNDTDLVVLLVDDDTGSASLLTLNSDYTVSGEGNEEGGLINVVVAPATGKRLKVTRVVDILQLTDLRNQGKIFAEIHEDALDLLTMIAQQHESGINSSLRVAESDPEPARIPAVAQRAGKILSFDANGNPQVVAPVTDSSTELRLELADPAQGVAKIARGVMAVDSIAELLALPDAQRREDLRYLVKGYHAGSEKGGGEFYWSASAVASSHDGGHFISPQKSFPSDWTITSSVVDWFTAPLSGTGVFSRSREGLSACIRGESFGALPDSGIDHSPIFDAIYRANTGLSEVVFGRGVFLSKSPFTVRNGSKLRGINRTETVFEGMGVGNSCVRLENSGTGRTLNCRVVGIGARNSLSFTGKTFDFDGASYCHFEDIQATIVEGSPTAWADCVGVSIVWGGASFNGYNTLKDCYSSFNRVGLIVDVNDMVIQGGAFNRNGHLGIDIVGGAAYTILSAEVSGNGTANDPANHGGCRFSGIGLFCSGVWNEYNKDMFPGIFSPNNWITENGKGVTILPGRPDIASSGITSPGYAGRQGVQNYSSVGDGDTSTHGIIRNGNFSLRGSNNTPLGWLVEGSATANVDAGMQSKLGYSSGVRFTFGSGVPKFTQRILSDSEVTQYRGQKIFATWVFLIPSTSVLTSSARIGLWLRSSAGMSDGAFVSLNSFPTGTVLQHTVQLTISDAMANTPYPLDAALQIDSGEVVLFGCSVSIGTTPWLNFNRPVTDAGGTIYGSLQIEGPVVLPTYADNIAASAGGLAAGRVYKTSTGEVRVVV